MSGRDARLEALREEARKGAFESIVLGQHFWIDDPLDDPDLHATARRKFEDIVHAVAGRGGSRLMVVLGEVGTGKTHLLRAMRSCASHKFNAFCAYSQFTSSPLGWRQHFLAELVASLDKTIQDRNGLRTGFGLVFDACLAIAPEDSAELLECWEADVESNDTTELVNRLTSRVLRGAPGSELNTVRALIYANSPKPELREFAKHYLRGDPLGQEDQAQLRALPAPHGPPDYRRLLIALLQTLSSLSQGPFVYFFDQAENLTGFGEDGPQQALHVISDLLSFTPNLITVIAWEQRRYDLEFAELPLFLQDRLTAGEVQVLPAFLEENMVRGFLANRISKTLSAKNLASDPDEPLTPLPMDLPRRLDGRNIRATLQLVRQVVEGDIGELNSGAAEADRQLKAIDASWLTSLAHFSAPAEFSDIDLIELVSWVIADVWSRTGSGVRSPVSGRTTVTFWLDLDLVHPSCEIPLRILGLTRNSKGSGLLRQFEGAIAVGGNRLPIGIRRWRWPRNGRTQTVQCMAELFGTGGGRMTISDDELRTMLAYREFVETRRRDGELAGWVERARVIEDLAAVQSVLGLINDYLLVTEAGCFAWN